MAQNTLNEGTTGVPAPQFKPTDWEMIHRREVRRIRIENLWSRFKVLLIILLAFVLVFGGYLLWTGLLHLLNPRWS